MVKAADRSGSAGDTAGGGRRSYADKRDFDRTPEPRDRARRTGTGAAGSEARSIFVVQKHAARRLHWDFRLEHDGTLWSWAVPKGPSMDPADKRLAVHVEDHPVDYAGFEGEIPKGNYGAGTVEIWDRGTWAPLDGGDPAEALARGELKITLKGDRLRGGFVLVRLKPRKSKTAPRGNQAQADDWLLIKEHDGEAHEGMDAAKLEQAPSPEARPPRSRAPRRKPAAAAPPTDQQPQLARLVEHAPHGAGWISEIKYDGYRLLARRDGDDVRLITRNGLDWTDRLTPLAKAVAALPAQTLLLDGELVAFDAQGRTSFSKLQAALSDRHADRLRYVAFDLLFLDGVDLRSKGLGARQDALGDLLDGVAPPIQTGGHLTSDAARVRDKVCELGLEGIVCKRIDAPYRAGRGGDWVKVKCHDREEFAVLGWTDPKGTRGGLGALYLGYRDANGAWRGAGGVGTGFDAAMLRTLRARLDGLAAGAPDGLLVAEAPPKGVHWVRPELVVEVRHAGWTGGGQVRHAAFLGLREDKPADEVVRTPPASDVAPHPFAAAGGTTRIVQASRPSLRRAPVLEIAGQRITHPDRELWPGIGKADLARYWEAMAPVALAGIAHRPLALVRCPDGIDGERFFQKHAGRGQPAAIVEGAFDEAPYLTIEDTSGLIACVQVAAIELHSWGSALDDPGHPDRLVFDLDPGEGVGMGAIADAARLLRDRLTRVGLASFCRTSGGKGLHVVAPLKPEAGWDAARAWSRRFAEALAAEFPDRFVAATRKDIRRGRILIDWLRNGLGSTAIASFSPRAREGAHVAMPLDWRSVTARLDPGSFTVHTVPKRVLRAAWSDPWAGFARAARALPAGKDRRI